MTIKVVQITDVVSEKGGKPIQVRAVVRFARTVKKAEEIAEQLASSQPEHGQDGEVWWARTSDHRLMRLAIETE